MGVTELELIFSVKPTIVHEFLNKLIDTLKKHSTNGNISAFRYDLSLVTAQAGQGTEPIYYVVRADVAVEPPCGSSACAKKALYALRHLLSEFEGRIEKTPLLKIVFDSNEEARQFLRRVAESKYFVANDVVLGNITQYAIIDAL